MCVLCIAAHRPVDIDILENNASMGAQMTRIVTTHTATIPWRGGLLAAASLALSIAPAFAQKTAPGDRVYELHSEAQGSCPALDWHMVAGPSGVLTGMITWDNWKVAAMITGTIMPLVKVERSGKPLGGNPQSRTFRGIVSEVGGRNRIANINGTIEANGWLNADIQGHGVVCKHIKVPLFVPAPPG